MAVPRRETAALAAPLERSWKDVDIKTQLIGEEMGEMGEKSNQKSPVRLVWNSS